MGSIENIVNSKKQETVKQKPQESTVNNSKKKRSSVSVNKISSGKKRKTSKKSSSVGVNENINRVLGISLIAISVYFAFCMFSYLFTGYQDNSVVTGNSLWDLFSEKFKVENWGGKLGAYISHLLYIYLFGIGSFGIPFIGFLVGMKQAFKIDILPFWKSVRFACYIMIWISLVLGFTFGENPDTAYLGGAFGYKVSLLIAKYIGTIGTYFLYFILMICFTAFNFNFPNKQIREWIQKRKTEREATKEQREAIAAEKKTKKRLEKEEKKAAKKLRESENKSNDLKADKPVTVAYNTEEYAVDEDLPEDIVFETKKRTVQPDNVIDFEIINPQIKQEQFQPFIDPEENSDEIIDKKSSTQEVKLEIIDNDDTTDKIGLENNIINENDHIKENELAIQNKSTEDRIHFSVDEPYDPTLDLPHFVNPEIDLLEEYGNGEKVSVRQDELHANKKRIEETLSNYQISIQKISATIGPTVTLYEIVPAPGVRISKIKNLEDDIALSLSALGIRIIAPIPGKGTIGIEVPNQKPEIVSMKSVLISDRFQNSSFELPIAIGKTISNEPYIVDLAKMPHLLMAGATGQGKSVGLNAIISSLLYKKHPAYLKFVMIDPKKVELNIYSKIERHYLAKLPDSEEAIITDVRKVVRTLNSLTIEMDNRYELLKDAQVKNIREYNAKFIERKLNPMHGHRFLPYIVLVIDEFADLIMTAGKEVEMPIARLAQLARAIGIHLIIATQRPSVNIITGAIKANFPARIAFRVVSKIDSRTILDSGGADQLIGRGDMLLSTGSDIIRLQCAFIDTPEIERISEFIGSQRAYPDAFHLPECPDEEKEAVEDFNPAERDSLFEDAARIIVQTQQGSTSLLQRKLKLGYNRAGRIIDQLEAAGIVGPFEGSKAREVRVANEIALEQILKDLDNNFNKFN